MRVTREKVVENRERILQAAANLFAQGLHGVGVAETMAAAGLTHGGFYNHFASKEELQVEACALVFRQGAERVARIAARQDPAERRAPRWSVSSPAISRPPRATPRLSPARSPPSRSMSRVRRAPPRTPMPKAPAPLSMRWPAPSTGRTRTRAPPRRSPRFRARSPSRAACALAIWRFRTKSSPPPACGSPRSLSA